jgi:invasion protein IalB
MYRAAACSFAIIMLACAAAPPAAGEDASPPAPIYSPWARFCLGKSCFTGRDARTECGPLVAAVLIESEGEAKKILRVTLAPGAALEHGVRISIDDDQAVARPFGQCFANGCMADYETDASLIAQLKAGRQLVVEGTDSASRPIRHAVPLAGFAAAYDGPPMVPRVFEEQVPNLQDELRRRALQEEARRAAAGCQPKQ